MGQAPKIIEGIRRSREQIREDERRWELDAGEVKPVEDPDEDPRLQPHPVRVAIQTFD